jgi:hypothetical protein
MGGRMLLLLFAAICAMLAIAPALGAFGAPRTPGIGQLWICSFAFIAIVLFGIAVMPWETKP